MLGLSVERLAVRVLLVFRYVESPPEGGWRALLDAPRFDGAIEPLLVEHAALRWSDWLVMAALTLSLFVIGYGFRGPGRINRIEGAVLLACYVGYTAYLISTVFGGQA